MIYVLGNCKESVELNAEKFAEAAKLESVSAAALCKARAKIGWEAFREVFEECAALAPVGKLYQGYELIAVDGMKGEMPNLPTLKETYPVNARQSYPMFHAMSAYDPLNEIFLAASFQAAPADEREMAMELLDAENVKGQKAIWLFDRGFPSVALIQKLERMGARFVMRVCGSFRACLVSCQEQTDKSEGNHPDGIVEKSLTTFPKSAAFVNPAESAFHNSALGKNYESMKLIPLYNFHFRAADGFDSFHELFARISSVGHDFLQQIQIIGCVTIAGNHAESPSTSSLP